MKELLESEKRKYSKLIELDGFSYELLQKLKNSNVAVVGLTGIGVNTLLTMISSGVGGIKIVDFNTVDINSLPQGTFFSTGDIGKLKTIALKEKLLEQRLLEKTSISNVELRESNIDNVLRDYEVIVYASYHKETLQLIGRYCIEHNKPLIWAVGCHYTSYLFYSTPEDVERYINIAISQVDKCFICDCYYPSYLSSIAGGIAASVTINALLNRATPFFRKCNVNTLKVEYIQPD